MGRIDVGPGVDDGADLDGFEVGEGEVVGRREGQDVAFACHGLGSEEVHGEGVCGGMFGMILGLLFLDGAVVVDEYKGAGIGRVGVALGALIARTEVALCSVRFCGM